ncbi:hypothetical protein PHJA_000114600 [Phtheirospermum japonicum]|uniref:Uncharacterized protein n=1 Tax=Phtheirospermum japonicum TaxID=374723 RepID=A0A830BCC7_9LAMI|nr:hypothetical protein PHJA_000114600 [Phtheirospermum japonicum]
MSDSLSNRCFTYAKLKFFTRMRRLLRINAVARRETTPPPEETVDDDMDVHTQSESEEDTIAGKSDGGDDWKVALRRSVKLLHFGSWEEKDAAAAEIEKLAEEDVARRKTVAALGVVPPLVAMVGSEVAPRRRLAVGALIVLANGSSTNKALMVEAGILSKLPENIGALSQTERQQIAQLLLSISALSKSQFSIPSSRIIPIIVSILESYSNSIETRELCLTTLYNLSSVLDTIATFVDTKVIDILIRLSSIKEVSENSFATLGNLVVTLAGRKSIEHNPMVPECLIEILTWEDKPKCQELSSYMLMVLAHQSSLQRRKMAKAGIVQILLEVVLMGSPLAQKRALKILQWFKDERQVRIGPHSGPQMGRIESMGSPHDQRGVDEGKFLMKKIVRQSLFKNMETITRRANGDEDSSSSLKALVISSSSKSLPY